MPAPEGMDKIKAKIESLRIEADEANERAAAAEAKLKDAEGRASAVSWFNFCVFG
jgi:hypothetical protein